MGFMDVMQDVLNDEKTLTTNGAVAYRTSGKELVDFNFDVPALRNTDESVIADRFAKVFYENRLVAIKYLFYLGDVRGGLGERKSYRACFDWLVRNYPEISIALLPLIPEYTRWDNLSRLIDDDRIGDKAVTIIKTQLDADIHNMNENRPVSLCAKWLPSENASSANTKKLGKMLAKKLGITSKQYRKILSSLRGYLNVVEVKMSKGEWGNIQYESVPSRANLIYSDAFLRNDAERREAYLGSLRKGETKINASVLQPHEITCRYRLGNYRMQSVDDTLEALWKALPDISIENTLVVRDGSVSMTWGECGNNGATPLDVATALAIYMAEHNSGGWKDRYITFSARPKIIDLHNCKTLYDKVNLSMCEADCSNTNIYATMKLILDTAVRNKMLQEDMPRAIVICSDMQFDGKHHNFGQSLFDSISEEYIRHGYQMPRICFWNLNPVAAHTIPMQRNEMGLILCSGFSIQTLLMLMSGKTDPYDVLLEQLNSDRYQPVENVLGDVL